MFIALRGSKDHTLKADWLLIDPVMKLKADCPKIQEYLHVSQYDSLIDKSCMRLVAFTLLTPIGRLPILNWGKASDQIRNTSSLFRDISFLLLDWRVHSICVIESGVPKSERDRLSV
jgi:hypothetical protein